MVKGTHFNKNQHSKTMVVENLWGVSGPVVRALDSGSDGPGSSPGWGTTLWP